VGWRELAALEFASASDEGRRSLKPKFVANNGTERSARISLGAHKMPFRAAKEGRMMSSLSAFFHLGRRLMLAALVASATARAQTPTTVAPKPSPELSAQIASLTQSLQRTQAELAESRTEIRQLRTALEEMLKRMDTLAPSQATADQSATSIAQNAPQTRPDEARPAQISQDEWDILNARVDEQRQTKVESGSKFRLKLSGIALFNAFSVQGQVDNLDFPSLAFPKFIGYPEGGTGASVRQSIVGLTGFGPELFGAHTSGELQVGFYGGLPSGYMATSSGIANVRIARIRFDWKNSSAVAGLDYPFFSPNLPTTYMSVAVPAFALAGNLWTWTPTIRVERRFEAPLSGFKVEAGFLDPSSSIQYTSSANLRIPNPTEASQQPTFAVRLSANRKSEDRAASLGISGLYSPQEFSGGFHATGWAGMLDWKFPMLPRTELSGQFFTGRGIDGFGGAPLNPYTAQNALLYNNLGVRLLSNIGVIGGWSQFKLKVNARNEFNAAAGTGGRNSFVLRQVATTSPSALFPARNQMFFVNYIFRPRSDLLFSAEYRRLRTYEVVGAPDYAGQVGLALGFLF
jgi:hypothetical protein